MKELLVYVMYEWPTETLVYCIFTYYVEILHAIKRQISVLFINNKGSVFCSVFSATDHKRKISVLFIDNKGSVFSAIDHKRQSSVLFIDNKGSVFSAIDHKRQSSVLFIDNHKRQSSVLFIDNHKRQSSVLFTDNHKRQSSVLFIDNNDSVFSATDHERKSSVLALLTGVILKGLTLWKFVSDICVCMFYVCKVIGSVDWLDRGLIYMWEEFRNVYLLVTWVWLSWGDPVWLTGHQNPITTPTTVFSANDHKSDRCLSLCLRGAKHAASL